MILKLTIFTPTYNRSNLLSRIYRSLLNQRSFDFEWLIIDDGSTDDTKKVVDQFIDNGKVPVKYYKKDNGGKHTAHNMAVKLAKGDYFMCLDSDDWLSDRAIEFVFNALESCSSHEGLIAYKADTKGRLLSDSFPSNLLCVGTVELSLKYKCNGEFTLVYPTGVLREYPFPVFEGEKFITECVLYDRISDICNMRLIPNVICICEYQEEGYSNNINLLMKNNPIGFSVYFRQRIQCQTNLLNKIIIAGKYNCFRMIAGYNTPTYVQDDSATGLIRVTRPLGVIFWLYYKAFRGF